MIFLEPEMKIHTTNQMNDSRAPAPVRSLCLRTFADAAERLVSGSLIEG